MARLELPRGQWAELREALSHGAAKELRKAWVRADGDNAAMFDVQTIYARAFVREWNVVDPDGRPIALADPDAIERAPDDVIDAIFQKALPAEKPAVTPKAPTSEPSTT